jgi:lipopolysaccharide export LptBFGC system permease protein LptF
MEMDFNVIKEIIGVFVTVATFAISVTALVRSQKKEQNTELNAHFKEIERKIANNEQGLQDHLIDAAKIVSGLTKHDEVQALIKENSAKIDLISADFAMYKLDIAKSQSLDSAKVFTSASKIDEIHSLVKETTAKLDLIAADLALHKLEDARMQSTLSAKMDHITNSPPDRTLVDKMDLLLEAVRDMARHD